MDTPIDDDLGGGGENLRYIRTVQPDKNGEFIRRLTPAEKANFYTAVAVDADGNVSEAGEVCPADSDGDGLCDPDEQRGFVDVDRNGSSDQPLGTAGDPVVVGVRDVMLEADWMTGTKAPAGTYTKIDTAFKDAPGTKWNLHVDGATGSDDEEIAAVPIGLWQDVTAGQDDVFDYRYGAEESSTGDNRACNGTFGRASDRIRNGLRDAPGGPSDRIPLRAVRRPQQKSPATGAVRRRGGGEPPADPDDPGARQ